MPVRINVPPITRALLGALVTLSFANTVFRFRQPVSSSQEWSFGVPFIALVPLESYIFPWTVATSTFVEQNVLSLAASALTIFYGGRYLERAWGGAEYAKFVLFVTMIPNLFAFFSYLIWYLVRGDSARGVTTINGAVGLEAAFLVAFKQLVPEHTVSLFKAVVRIRVKHFPAIFVLANMVSGPLLGTDTALFLSLYGFFTSWIYLRFYGVSPSVVTSATGEGPGIKGDASDTFAFSHFFPEPVQSVIAPLCDQVYELLVALKICSPFSSEAIEAGNEHANARAEGGLPTMMGPVRGSRLGVRREEAERRRALALKALDQRLNAAAAGRPDQSQERPETATESIEESAESADAPGVEEPSSSNPE